jgi:hypothetical protein
MHASYGCIQVQVTPASRVAEHRGAGQHPSRLRGNGVTTTCPATLHGPGRAERIISRLRHSHIFPDYRPESDSSQVVPDYSQLFADRTLLAERLCTSTLEPVAQQIISLIIVIMVNCGALRCALTALVNAAACFADSSTSTILADCATSPSTDALAAASYFDSCWRTALRHSDVLTMTSWMGLTWSRTVDCLPRQRFPSQEVVLGRVGFADALNASGPVRGQRVAWRGGHRMWVPTGAAFDCHISTLAAGPRPAVAELDA